MPIVPHLAELVFSLVWAGFVALFVVVLAVLLRRRRRHLNAVSRDRTTSHDEQGQDPASGH